MQNEYQGIYQHLHFGGVYILHFELYPTLHPSKNNNLRRVQSWQKQRDTNKPPKVKKHNICTQWHPGGKKHFGSFAKCQPSPPPPPQKKKMAVETCDMLFFSWNASPWLLFLFRLVAQECQRVLRLLRLFGWRCFGCLWTSYTDSTRLGGRCSTGRWMEWHESCERWVKMNRLRSCLSKDIQW